MASPTFFIFPYRFLDRERSKESIVQRVETKIDTLSFNCASEATAWPPYGLIRAEANWRLGGEVSPRRPFVGKLVLLSDFMGFEWLFLENYEEK